MGFLSSCGLLVAALLALAFPRPAAAQDGEPPHLREQVGSVSDADASARLEHTVEEHMVLPPGYPPALDHMVLAHLEVSPTGQVENPSIVPQAGAVDPVIASAILTAVRQLPVLVPGRRGGQPVRAALTLLIRPGVAAAAANEAAEARAAAEADSLEARTLRAGTIRARPGETLGQLLQRTLPASCPDSATQLVRYAWWPNPAGPQQFFDARGHGDQGQYEAALFVLNPLGAGAYHVQCLDLGSMGDVTDVAAIFFADANHDGQKDLLTLTRCDLREYVKVDGQTMPARFAHYQTTAIYYRGPDANGRPRYEQQYRADLDELATAAEVREALAAPPRRPKSAPKRNPAAKAAK